MQGVAVDGVDGSILTCRRRCERGHLCQHCLWILILLPVAAAHQHQVRLQLDQGFGRDGFVVAQLVYRIDAARKGEQGAGGGVAAGYAGGLPLVQQQEGDLERLVLFSLRGQLIGLGLDLGLECRPGGRVIEQLGQGIDTLVEVGQGRCRLQHTHCYACTAQLIQRRCRAHLVAADQVGWRQTEDPLGGEGTVITDPGQIFRFNAADVGGDEALLTAQRQNELCGGRTYADDTFLRACWQGKS